MHTVAVVSMSNKRTDEAAWALVAPGMRRAQPGLGASSCSDGMKNFGDDLVGESKMAQTNRSLIMKRVLAALCALAGASGCYGTTYVETPAPQYGTTMEYIPEGPPPPISVTMAPPAPRYEAVLTCGYGTIYVPGRWEFSGRWYWARGYCSPVRPGHIYVGPRFIGGVYHRAHWAPSGYGAPAYPGGTVVAPPVYRPAPVYGGPTVVNPPPARPYGAPVYTPPPAGGGYRPPPSYPGSAPAPMPPSGGYRPPPPAAPAPTGGYRPAPASPGGGSPPPFRSGGPTTRVPAPGAGL